MKQQYKEISFRSDTLALIDFMNSMINDYIRQGFKLSVRQLYYQLVARAVIENTEQSYKRIASIINDARLAGMIDWDAIEDRNRDIEVQTRWSDGAQIVQAAADSFHMDMWDNQLCRVFVIVEKAALAGVLDRVCRKYDVPLLAARGYPSVSIVRELALDHIQSAMGNGQLPVILHLGDHDPSGIDMTRDLSERIRMFAEEEHYQEKIELRRIALTMDQIRVKRPPPNPAKTTDARFKDYMRKFGHESWELDALEPAFLVDLVETEFQKFIDDDDWKERSEEIEAIRVKLNKVADDFRAQAA
jgi:hypothetical protein